MKYIIIGLGNYGHMLAEELSALGHEVIGADVSASRVDSIKEKIATAFVLDATDEQALAVLPLSGVDVVVVAYWREFWRFHSCSGFAETTESGAYLCAGYDNVPIVPYFEAFDLETDFNSGGRCCSS